MHLLLESAAVMAAPLHHGDSPFPGTTQGYEFAVQLAANKLCKRHFSELK